MARLAFTAAALAGFVVAAFASPVVNNLGMKKRDYSGQATFYYPDGGDGACGSSIQNIQYALALSSDIYNGGQYCYDYVTITNTDTGTTQTAQVLDECPGCGEYDIDLTIGLFEALGGTVDEGVFPVEWSFN